MKRALFQNVKVVPYTSGTTIDRLGFLSLILAANAAGDGPVILTLTHSDDGVSFVAADDTRLEVRDPPAITTGGIITVNDVASGDTVNVDIDLVGLKRYLSIAISGDAGTGAAAAYALGDPDIAPV